MPNCTVLRRTHLVAGIVGFLTILTFRTSTVASELLGSHAAIAAVKSGILWGMLVVIPAMIIVGGSGFRLADKAEGTLVRAKKRRMPFIALNGILILLPSAIVLSGRASAGLFDTAFYVVQAIELVAGAVNIVLMGLNIRDGLSLSGGRSRRPLRAA